MGQEALAVPPNFATAYTPDFNKIEFGQLRISSRVNGRTRLTLRRTTLIRLPLRLRPTLAEGAAALLVADTFT